MPLYIYPSPSAITAYWFATRAPRLRPGFGRDVVGGMCLQVPTDVIINPGSGDLNACLPNSDWQAAMAAVSNCGMLGSAAALAGSCPTQRRYVYTNYGTRLLADVYNVIDNYVLCWGSRDLRGGAVTQRQA